MKHKFLDLLRNYIVTLTTGVLIPFYNLFASLLELSQKQKIYLLEGLIFFTFGVMLPFDYVRNRKRRHRKEADLMELDKRRQSALENLLIYQKLAKDEFFRVERIQFQDTINGSDVFRIVNWSGVNRHPMKKSAAFFRGVVSSGASLDLFETITRDELRNQQLYPKLIETGKEGATPEWAVFEIRFQPIRYNQRAKFSHKPIVRGYITTNPSSISYLTGNFARGVKTLEGVIRLSQKPLSYSALSVAQNKSGITYREMPGIIHLTPKQDNEGYYNLDFKIDNPPPLFIVEFYLK